MKGVDSGKMDLSKMYDTIYNIFCGYPPDTNIFHDEWLFRKDVSADIRRQAHNIKGKTLDVGCGRKPYENWFPNVTDYIGLDVGENPVADCLVAKNQRWPFPDSVFDTVVSFQAFEHIRDIKLVQSEIRRVIKPHGIICLSVPFLAYEHGAPSDYRRVSKYGIQHFFPDYEIIEILPQGGFGSAVGTLLLRFVRVSMRRTTRVTRIIWALLLPVWMFFTAFINIGGWLVDKLDGTGSFYHNVLLLVRKPE
jgi:SAM-dependent methyltransferase